MVDIDKQFPGVKALDHAQFQLKSGEIHALMGENGAGKSTLMKCLFGIYKKDKGSVSLEGREVHINDPRHALDHGVAMVHQELNQVLRRSVMENMWLGRFPRKAGFIDHKKMYEDTLRIFDQLEIKLNPKDIIGDLSVSKRQMAEIAKVVSFDAKVIVLDEPTSSLATEEAEHLFHIIKKLAAKGVGIVFISHKMDEILRNCHRVTVMRDGKWIATRESSDLTMNEIIKLMVGRDLTNRFPPKTNKPGDVLLEVKNLTGKYMPSCIDASFDLRKGEILGIAGLVGSRRTELVQTVFGTMKKEGGEVLVRGTQVHNKDSCVAIRNGFALVTEERRATGIFPEMNIIFNSLIANMRSYAKWGFLSTKKMAKDTGWVVDSMNVKTPSQKTHIKYLSGGNQQKVIIGRWLLANPDILLMDEPTRGIDVGAKYEIYQLILNQANDGKGVVMVSSEMPELIGICDRILVMSNGRVAGILDMHEDHQGKEQELIMHMAAKYV